MCTEEIRQSGGLEEARRRLEAYEASLASIRPKPTPRPGETPLPIIELPVGQISDLLRSPRNPLDGKVLAWGISPSLWHDPNLLFEAVRDLQTFQAIITSRLRTLGVIDSIGQHEFWTREARHLLINAVNIPDSELFVEGSPSPSRPVSVPERVAQKPPPSPAVGGGESKEEPSKKRRRHSPGSARKRTKTAPATPKTPVPVAIEDDDDSAGFAPEALMTGALRVGSVELVDDASVPHLDKTATSEDDKEADNGEGNDDSDDGVDDFTDIEET
ncbi:hypothetical protein ASPSYDRAFT_89999 [Aspergillus sydowii CBS 593.65]|nr:uncharacterized protein ASPSYDRAFT_89999 [Aspergillus sydowii CBS 593.65]OJJ59286.1 hypothetical protein ASPSYDRAFT_89999 [Aspergillus sydowii CBS 593.65]